MARITAVINRKGGVGKTTTALCLADGLRRRGSSILLVDLDQQHNSTKQYGARMEGVATVYDLLTDQKTNIEECIQHTQEYGDIVAGDDWMNRAEEVMISLDSREYILKDALDSIRSYYDYIIIDCPPTLGLVVKNVLVAADDLVIPMLCDGYSIDGFTDLMQQIDSVRSNIRLNPNLKIAGVLLTQYEQGQRLVKYYDTELPHVLDGFSTRLFKTRIRRCCKVKEAQAAAVSLFDYAPDCTAALDYWKFIDEYLGPVVINPPTPPVKKKMMRDLETSKSLNVAAPQHLNNRMVL